VKRLIIISMIFFYFLPFVSEAQNPYTLQIIRLDGKKLNCRYEKKFISRTGRDNEILNVVDYLHTKAFLEASCDSISPDTLKTIAYVFQGPKYVLNDLKIDSSSMKYLDLAGFKPTKFRSMAFSEKNIHELTESLLIWFEDHGYPFAKVSLDSFSLNNGEVSAEIRAETGNRIMIDSLVRKGNIRISRNYIYRYLGIRGGSIYDESKIARIQKRLQELPFATVAKSFEVAFWEDKAKVYLYLNKKKASSFSGIIGILPNSLVPGKVLINGDVKLRLLNSFAQGELIDLNWRSLEKGTQDLKVKLNYPYIFTTPFGVDYEFYLYKKDTSYLTLNHKVGLQLLFSSYNYIQVFADIFRSNIISAEGLENATVLPDYADISKTLYGLEFYRENLDYRLNPRKGFRIDASAAGGLKKIRENDQVNPVLYDSLDLKSGQFQAKLDAGWFIPVYRKHVILLGLKGSYIWSDVLFNNELFRFGGLNSLKGFDEESLRANLFGIFLFEYRFLFERNSYLALFWNGAYLERKTHNESASDRPYGFGAGISFDTKVGIFSLYYALGSQNGNPIYFKQSKIHFGISTSF
jgi:outer membrane protein assembly factor BamA